MTELIGFVALSALIIVTPGPDTILTIRNTLLGGRPGGVLTAAGVATGQLVWTVATSAGLAALLVASEPAFVAVRLVGACYLIYLGLSTLRSALDGAKRLPSEASAPKGAPFGRVKFFRQGLISNLGNPKMAVFFTSLLPQFVPTAAFGGLMSLGVLFCVMTLSWLSGYAVAVAAVGNVLRKHRIRRSLEAITGTALVGMGFALAVDARR